MSGSDLSILPICLRPHSAGKSVTADDPQLVNSAGDHFMFVACFELQGYNRPIAVNYAGLAHDMMAEWSRSQVLDFNMCADGTFARLQGWQHRLARGVFQEPDEPGCRKDGRHLLVGKVDRVLLLDREVNFADCANLGM